MRPAEALVHDWILEGLPDLIKYVYHDRYDQGVAPRVNEGCGSMVAGLLET